MSLMVSRALCGSSSRSNLSPLLSPCSTETLRPVRLFFPPGLTALCPEHSHLPSEQYSVLCWSSRLPILHSVPAFGESAACLGSQESPSILPGPDNFPAEPKSSSPSRCPGHAQQTHLFHSGQLLTWSCPKKTPQSGLANQELTESSQLHRLPFSAILDKDLPFQEGIFL